MPDHPVPVAIQTAHIPSSFDEADALFGQRVQVKDGDDRFAKIAIHCLLQRIERFNGIAIPSLTTPERQDRE